MAVIIRISYFFVSVNNMNKEISYLSCRLCLEDEGLMENICLSSDLIKKIQEITTLEVSELNYM